MSLCLCSALPCRLDSHRASMSLFWSASPPPPRRAVSLRPPVSRASSICQSDRSFVSGRLPVDSGVGESVSSDRFDLPDDSGVDQHCRIVWIGSLIGSGRECRFCQSIQALISIVGSFASGRESDRTRGRLPSPTRRRPQVSRRLERLSCSSSRAAAAAQQQVVVA